MSSGRRQRANRPRAEVLAVAHAASLDAATAEVVRALREDGTPSLLLRGPVVAAWLYEAPAEREYGDVDLLVPAERFARAERVLDALGFHESALEAAFPKDRPRHAHTWVRSGGLAIDLHRTLIGIRVPPNQVWEVLAERTESMSLANIAVDVPSFPARGIILALHAAHHTGAGEQPVEDLKRALASLPSEGWDEAFLIAQRLCAESAFSSGLRLTATGRGLLERWGAEIVIEGPGLIGGSSAFHLAQGLIWLRTIHGRREKLRFAVRKLLPPAELMRNRSRLARRGAGGLAAAYGLRWLRIARDTRRAVSALRRQ